MRDKTIAILLAAALLAGCAARTEPPQADPPPEPERAEAPAPEKAETPPAAPEKPPEKFVSAADPEPAPEPEPESAEPAPEPVPEAAEPVQFPAPAPPDTDPGPVPETEPAPDLEPAPEAEPPAPGAEAAEPRLLEEADGLYYVQEDGTYLTEGSVGRLYFGADGRCTCGDPALDDQIRAVLAEHTSGLETSREQRLREVFDYIRGPSFGYLGVAHYPAGSDGWVNESAAFILKNGKSNCYGFSALFCLCARQLGFQAYVVAGHEYSTTNEHAWVMIDWPDGQSYLFDPQIDNHYNCAIDTYKESTADGVYYDGHAYFFP